MRLDTVWVILNTAVTTESSRDESVRVAENVVANNLSHTQDQTRAEEEEKKEEENYEEEQKNIENRIIKEEKYKEEEE